MQKVFLSRPMLQILDQEFDIQNITHILLDLGRVLVPINQHATFRAFGALGAQGLEDVLKDYLKLDVLRRFESGLCSSACFFQELRAYMPPGVNDEQLRNAWCAMVGHMSLRVVNLLRCLRPHYRVLMLSNTNELHINFLDEHLRTDFDGLQLSDLFDHLYLSHLIGALKPDPAIYQYVLRHENIQPSQALFIDDRIENIEGARGEGITSVHLTPDLSLMDLFDSRDS